MSEPKVRVEFLDTTLRDGAQSLPLENQFPEGSKPKIAASIGSLGVNTIEAGFPATASDFEEVRQVAKTIGSSLFRVDRWSNTSENPISIYRPVTIAGLSRTKLSDIDYTWDAIRHATSPRIHTFISTDPEHMAAKFKDKSPDEVLEMGRRAVLYARELADTHKYNAATVEASAEAATTTDLEFLERVVKTFIGSGAQIINLPDTVGQKSTLAMQNFYKRAINWIKKEDKEVVISAHCHNDLGLANSNSYALISAACVYAAINDETVNIQIESTICGLGERAGNADVFSVVSQLFKFANEFPMVALEWEFNPSNSVKVANFVMSQAGLEVSRQNPVVGRDVNTHRSGIHSDGVIKGGYHIYTPHDPKFWGHATSAVHEDGKYQGANGRNHLTNA